MALTTATATALLSLGALLLAATAPAPASAADGCCAGPISGQGFGSFFPPSMLLSDGHVGGWDFNFYSDSHGNFAGRSKDGSIGSVLLNTTNNWYVWLEGPGSCKRLGGYAQPYNNMCTGTLGYFSTFRGLVNVSVGGAIVPLERWSPSATSLHYLMLDRQACLPVAEIGLGGVLGSGVQYHDVVRGPPPPSAFQVPASCPA